MYKTVIGLEVHVELNTKSKMFSPSKCGYSSIPNVYVTPIDMAFPGTMPTVNMEGVKSAIKMCLALNMNISNTLMFDRKNYYYPDLPKGFQITQMTKPIGKNGYLEIFLNGDIKKIYIHQLHIEEDAASFVHEENNSLIDYNRVGVPLIEIVTEPCIESVEEAIEFLESLRNILKYLNISDADQSKGQIRCDVNVSVMKEEDITLGVRTETKNINSFSSVKEVINYESKRQIELLSNGEKVKRETRRYSDVDSKTYSMREKAEAIDYKYYVEPNIPEYNIGNDMVKSIKDKLPMLQFERMNIYINNYGLSYIEAKTITKDIDISCYYEETLEFGASPKEACNWIVTKILGYLNKENISISEIFIKPEYLAELINLINTKIISTEQAKKVFELALLEKIRPQEIAEKYDMKQITDENEINKLIEYVLSKNIEAVNTYKSGKLNILGYLMGQVLKESKGKVNPELANKLLLKGLNS